jgi:hypothetical protein
MKTTLPYDEVCGVIREGRALRALRRWERKDEREPEALEAKGNITALVNPASPFSMAYDESETKRAQAKTRRVIHSGVA